MPWSEGFITCTSESSFSVHTVHEIKHRDDCERPRSGAFEIVQMLPALLLDAADRSAVLHVVVDEVGIDRRADREWAKGGAWTLFGGFMLVAHAQ